MSRDERQRIERVAGARRAKLTPAPGTSGEPVPADETEDPDAETGQTGGAAASGPNDERMKRDVPPHW